MKRRIKRVAPLQFGKMLAAFYAFFSVIFIPFMLLMTFLSPKAKTPAAAGIVISIVFPLLYIFLGFIMGIVSGFVYNLCAKWVGGIEIEFDEQG